MARPRTSETPLDQDTPTVLPVDDTPNWTNDPETPEPEVDASPVHPDILALGHVFAKAIADGRPPAKITIGEYTRRETARKNLPDCKFFVNDNFTVFQNGFRCDLTMAAEILAVNRLTRSGRYLGRRVEVQFNDEAGDLSVNFVYANKSIDQRLDRGWASFADLCTKCADEQDAEDAEDEAPRRRRKG
jgi:hypothetical protein